MNVKENEEKISTPLKLSYGGLAVFKKDKLIGWLNQEESIGYNYTQGNIQSTPVLLTCPKDNRKKITVEVQHTKNNIHVIMKHQKPVIKLKLKAEGIISDAQCEMDFSEPATITQVEQLMEKQLKKSVVSVVKTVQQKYKSDIFGFGEEVERTSPVYWEQVKGNWNDVFSDIEVNVRVEAKVRQMFKTSESLLERMKE
jgi:spore germination protein KC